MHIRKLRALIPVAVLALVAAIGSTIANADTTVPADTSGVTVSTFTIPGGRFGNLDAALNDSATGATAISTGSAVLPAGGASETHYAIIYDYPDKGSAKANVEVVTYDTATSTSINITARGALSTTAVAHPADSIVKSATRLAQAIGSSGGGSFTVEDDGEYFCDSDADCNVADNDDVLMIGDELIEGDWANTGTTTNTFTIGANDPNPCNYPAYDNANTCTSDGRGSTCYTRSRTSVEAHAVGDLVTVADSVLYTLAHTVQTEAGDPDTLAVRTRTLTICQLATVPDISHDPTSHPFWSAATQTFTSPFPLDGDGHAAVGGGANLNLTGSYSASGLTTLNIGTCLLTATATTLEALAAAKTDLTAQAKNGAQAEGTINLILDDEIDAANVAAISSVPVGNPGTVNTATNHGLTTGDTVQIIGSNASPSVGQFSVNGSAKTVTVVDADTFTVDGSNVTVAGGAAGWVFIDPASECDTPGASAPLFIDELTTYPDPNATFDSDGDGVNNRRELGLDDTCGNRNPWNPYDYYDVSIPRDGKIELFADVLLVIGNFDATGYGFGDAAFAGAGLKRNYDRPVPFENSVGWSRGAPDLKIELFVDVLGVIGQFNVPGCP